MRFIAIALCCIVLTGCASMRHAPPTCRGEYRPINPVHEVQQTTTEAPLVIEEVSGV